MHLKENTTLLNGRFSIIRVLGQGGFGVTYLARDTMLDVDVAIKEFFIGQYCNRDAATGRVSVGVESMKGTIRGYYDKFVKEAGKIRMLKHSNIVSVYEVFSENGTAYYAMDYHSGGSLSSLLKRNGALGEERALRYIRQVASALRYLHSRNMVHLDVKPDNILLDSDDNAVLIDFGISKHYDERGNATTLTPGGYTPGYAADSQMEGSKVNSFSPTLDIYSLGATLYNLLTGKEPPLIFEIYNYGFPPLPATVSAATRNAVEKCMSPKSIERPQSMDEFLALLDAQPVGDDSSASVSKGKGADAASRVPEPMDKGGSSSRVTMQMDKKSAVSDNVGAATANNEPKKPFNWKIPVGIVAAIKHISDSIAAVQQRLLAKNAALKQAAEQRRRDSIANLPGKLYVTTTPVGATVTVDGQRIGTTPINAYELKKGSYNVKIAKEGYKEYTERITITAEPANINTVLAANPVQQQQKSTASVVDGKKHTFTVNGVSFTMVAVAGGTFNMGSNDGEGDEKPVHSVTLSDYYIGETEVTQALWQAVMGSNPSNFKGSSNPVEQVSYDDCIDFINKLNTLLAGQLPAGRKFRLPTEAEWEFAARGGNKSKGYKYSGSNSIDAVAWYRDNSNKQTHPVKQKQPNELGLYDMTGNVLEWCNDWYGKYSSRSQTNPQGPSSGSYRVLRGGDWSYNAKWCRVAVRVDIYPGYRHYHCGLRLAF